MSTSASFVERLDAAKGFDVDRPCVDLSVNLRMVGTTEQHDIVRVVGVFAREQELVACRSRRATAAAASAAALALDVSCFANRCRWRTDVSVEEVFAAHGTATPRPDPDLPAVYFSHDAISRNTWPGASRPECGMLMR